MADIEATLERIEAGMQRLTIDTDPFTMAKLLAHLSERLGDPEASLASLNKNIEFPFREGI